MELDNLAPRRSSETRIMMQSLPQTSPPRISNPTAVISTANDVIVMSGGPSNSVRCVVVDLGLVEDTVVECQSTKLSSVSNAESEKACRICHASSGCTAAGIGSDLVELGCSCKNGLGVAHKHCAESWFKIRGNRCCEICGSDAININRFKSVEVIDVGHDGRDDIIENPSLERRGQCWINRLFCNFLIACLLVAFIVPWFFRLNLF